jgi:hypothetical protein
LPTTFLIPISKINKTPDAGCCKRPSSSHLTASLAGERMTLFMERINPSQLMVRIVPFQKIKRLSKFCNSTDQEFEHNLSQQIYISEKCWSIIVTAKNATIQMMRLAEKRRYKDADGLRQVISDLLEKPSPSSAALAFIKK